MKSKHMKARVNPTPRHVSVVKPASKLSAVANSFAPTWNAVLKHTEANVELHRQLRLVGPFMVKLLREQPESPSTASAIASFASFGTDTPAVNLVGLDGPGLSEVFAKALTLVK